MDEEVEQSLKANAAMIQRIDRMISPTHAVKVSKGLLVGVPPRLLPEVEAWLDETSAVGDCGSGSRSGTRRCTSTRLTTPSPSRCGEGKVRRG